MARDRPLSPATFVGRSRGKIAVAEGTTLTRNKASQRPSLTPAMDPSKTARGQVKCLPPLFSILFFCSVVCLLFPSSSSLCTRSFPSGIWSAGSRVAADFFLLFIRPRLETLPEFRGKRPPYEAGIGAVVVRTVVNERENESA